MIPWPYGGKQRQIMVDLEPDKLYSYGLSAADVSAAINLQNLILPSGTAKMGTQEYYIRLNSSPEVVDAINDLPIKTVNGTTEGLSGDEEIIANPDERVVEGVAVSTGSDAGDRPSPDNPQPKVKVSEAMK